MRKSGYYRVKHCGKWKIAEYEEVFAWWFMPISPVTLEDSDFDKDPITGKPMINETPINPEP